MATASVPPSQASASQGQVLPVPDCAGLRYWVWRTARLYPDLRGRLIAAAELAALYEIRRLDKVTYSVPSQANALGSYTVTVGREGAGTCTCPDYPRAPRGYCKHRLAVMLVCRLEEEAAARRPAPPRPDDSAAC